MWCDCGRRRRGREGGREQERKGEGLKEERRKEMKQGKHVKEE